MEKQLKKMRKLRMIKIVCDKCGSDALEFSATGVWLLNKQEHMWQIDEGAWCCQCEDHVATKEVKMTIADIESINQFELLD
jgi:hypothetical protein